MMIYLAFVAVLLAIPGALAQSLAQSIASAAGSNWQRVQQLPVHTKVHIAADKHGGTCRLFSVGEEALTCSGHGGKPGRSILRSSVKSVKLTRTAYSTLTGAVVGLEHFSHWCRARLRP